MSTGVTRDDLVIGTAGHIDHGKSRLVQALTGVDPDRLAEEKARGMTIDLGFASLVLPSGRVVAFVDVPGHNRFVPNMLAGTTGVRAALLVVAGDEGVMAQTREHAAILDLLGMDTGIVALTKADLIEPDLLSVVREEVAELVSGTSLAGYPVVEVSAVTGQGLEELCLRLDEIAAAVEPGMDGPGRLSVDRVFTATGFGTVVTGTMSSGRFITGQEVEMLPSGVRARIRGMQIHDHQVDVADAVSRVAINLSGVERQSLRR
ncbi:MAG TPA: selenocysteine-specific translation elongation factor, partial [Chloroflexota bacterium]|nr:selenocysteine-specific translation elongation factor [Chloroflexota bacterium]